MFARIALLEPPNAIHCTRCTDNVACDMVWGVYWTMGIGRKLRRIHDPGYSHTLSYIHTIDLLSAQIPEMNEECRRITLERVASFSCWLSGTTIVDGAIDHLMIPERLPEWEGGDFDIN